MDHLDWQRATEFDENEHPLSDITTRKSNLSETQTGIDGAITFIRHRYKYQDSEIWSPWGTWKMFAIYLDVHEPRWKGPGSK